MSSLYVARPESSHFQGYCPNLTFSRCPCDQLCTGAKNCHHKRAGLKSGLGPGCRRYVKGASLKTSTPPEVGFSSPGSRSLPLETASPRKSKNMLDNAVNRDCEHATITTNILNEAIAEGGLRPAFMIVGPKWQERGKPVRIDVLHKTGDAFVLAECAKHVALDGPEARSETIQDGSGLPWSITEVLISFDGSVPLCDALRAAGYDLAEIAFPGGRLPLNY